jgi:hypothetical protein
MDPRPTKTGTAAILERPDVVSARGDLQADITELVDFDWRNTAAWVTKVQNTRTEVIAGAIVMWVSPGGNALYTGDPMAPRREAAMAILQARFADQSSRQTQTMLTLTKWIAGLTGVMLVGVVAQIVIAIITAQSHS